MRRDVFQAIADPTRREIINMIAHQSLNLNAVSENFNISRPAISKHIKILTECGLIEIKQQGRERYCEAKLQKLNEVAKWIEQYRVFWTKKLDALESFLDSGSNTVKKSSSSPAGKKPATNTITKSIKKKQKQDLNNGQPLKKK
jgi:DNA-binding transcriptional ArsR family regulator